MKKDFSSGESTRGRLGVYGWLDHMPFLKGRYRRKFAAAALLAAVPPFITVVLYSIFAESSTVTGAQLVAAIGLTYLAGFMAALWMHRGLLAPLELTDKSIKEFLEDRLPPDLPTEFRDEAGRLMARTQYLLNLFERWGLRLESLSDLDEVTGVYNRRAGEARLAEEIARAERDLETFHLTLVDVRDFRGICETHGYETGDMVLLHLIGALIVNTRRGDWIVRWGNNQFLVGLHRNRNARLVTDRILEGIESLPCPIGKGEHLPLRVACAVVEYPFGSGHAGAIKLADEALSEAKAKSRPDGPSISVTVNKPGQVTFSQ
jgi:diguanylate cyclase (GGDEF)-like protein